MNKNPTSKEELEEKNLTAWDRLYADTSASVWGREESPFLRDILRESAPWIHPGCNLLDAGAGEGRNLPLLLSTGANVFACDASPKALAKIDEKVRRQVDVRQCRLAALPYAAHSFDVILLWDSVETLPDPDAVLKELFRVIRPGGCLICNIPGEDDGISGRDMTGLDDGGKLYESRFYFHFRTVDEARTLLEKAGFRVEKARWIEWKEKAHPGFRDYEHTHRSTVFSAAGGLSEKPDDKPLNRNMDPK